MVLRQAFNFDNSFARELGGLYVDWKVAGAPRPSLVALNKGLADELGLAADELASPEGVAVLAGASAPPGAEPLAQAYAGHQFGGFVDQLGDGRALLLGEVIGRDGRRRDIQLKGSGRTPFSRNGDGKAALGPVLREYMIAEAMHALSIPPTRALAAVTTGEVVRRETELPGAVLTRVADSHIRVGTFQFFAVRGDVARLRRLADYSIARHYPHVIGTADPYLKLFGAVLERQAELIARWMHVGFVHGGMYTDNMAISGETIDYGPCAFLDTYDPGAVFSSIDARGRYAFANQPAIAQWNLARFAETLIPLMGDGTDAAIRRLTGVLETFPDLFQHHWLTGMRLKLGLSTARDGDLELANGLLVIMAANGLDYCKTLRGLSGLAGGGNCGGAAADDPTTLGAWLKTWTVRCELESLDPRQRAQPMDAVNPVYIPRNHKVEEALAAAVDEGNYGPFERMNDVLARPFDVQPDAEPYAEGPPPGSPTHMTYCGT